MKKSKSKNTENEKHEEKQNMDIKTRETMEKPALQIQKMKEHLLFDFSKKKKRGSRWQIIIEISILIVVTFLTLAIRNPLHNAHVFRLDTVALQHNSFVPCHRIVALEHSSNASALAQACREKHSAFAHVHNRKEIFLTW